MSLAEIEKQVFDLPDEERQQFVHWFYENEDRIVPPLPGEEDYLSPEVMAEVIRRREELETGNMKLYTPEEMSQRVGRHWMRFVVHVTNEIIRIKSRQLVGMSCSSRDLVQK